MLAINMKWIEKWERMLIVGQVSSEEEKSEIRYIAQMVIIGERFRNLARQEKKNK